MSDIFLCYSKKDAAIANRLVEQLQAESWSVFIDRNTHVGRRWHKEIERELHTARAVVVLWSAQSRDSDYVLEEAEYGKRKDILFPALIESIELTYGFGRIQTAKLTDWEDGADHVGLTDLLTPLRLHLNGHAPEPSIIAVQPQQIVTSSLPEPGRIFRDKLKIGGEGPLMVGIPAGRFLMGSPEDELDRYANEGPQHEVQIAQPLAMGVYAVTFNDYDLFCQHTGREKPYDEGWGRKNRTAINVFWQDAQDYCAWLYEQTGRSYRLPSEAEWEYACRARSQTPHYTGEDITKKQANFNKDVGKTAPVGAYPSNPFGLYDMYGNVWEWCQDTWHDNYQGAPADGSSWETDNSVLRGGAWFSGGWNCRSADRFHSDPPLRSNFTGFRLARGH
ncbi:Formylglycine-generating enzyme, required for sulfatase activity, contains SUMF1/FGE domain [Nitrosomonas aestuarii]|uniref:Formylglycine-generating enzyme, required for sulfatase activity, contains SUMF1/FGE domain n=1 Tax=Nitrosomonas aestuarii TaxID=52441 RepID=A0A1I3Y439_9PROT|nr:SUMF1/EgtB/PvdO family nonheme iron enzyme [Nitrosomonas aestuarii]SFK26717.1 Formylglycine-generating enzyme, required for sulfatase activity, contains SUMF1/FGE domain [Nitrosomonas aestuarii]